ncbi:MAG: hypothetical protein HY861_01485 [Chlamydiia bacterium]|nr:hypothetical protein [Chlamydiia bacterium]
MNRVDNNNIFLNTSGAIAAIAAASAYAIFDSTVTAVACGAIAFGVCQFINTNPQPERRQHEPNIPIRAHYPPQDPLSPATPPNRYPDLGEMSHRDLSNPYDQVLGPQGGSNPRRVRHVLQAANYQANHPPMVAPQITSQLRTVSEVYQLAPLPPINPNLDSNP